jgi:membrane-associated phospholipid phosphatase
MVNEVALRRRYAVRVGAACCALLLCAAPASRADWTQAAPADKVVLLPAADLALTAGGMAFWLGTELLKNQLAPAACRICNGVDNSGLPTGPGAGQGGLNGVDAFFHDQLTGALWSRKGSDTISNILGFGLFPAGALLASAVATGNGSSGAGLRGMVISIESLAVAGTLIQSIKYSASRKRPFVRYGHANDGSTDAEAATYDVNNPDSHLSFPSGHTGATAALTVSAAMLATLQESKAAPYLWAGAAVCTVSVAALRMMAEKHYFTDVLVGAAVGAGSGVLVPWLHKKGGPLDGSGAANAQLQLAPVQGGTALALAGQF